ncbi:hypothetical protein E4U14_003346 [Claviceps sp. LM454 group G7]|nr:hypothetical protein E4U14_003346 [Claviceps sp. LM454 group G7]
MYPPSGTQGSLPTQSSSQTAGLCILWRSVERDGGHGARFSGVMVGTFLVPGFEDCGTLAPSSVVTVESVVSLATDAQARWALTAALSQESRWYICDAHLPWRGCRESGLLLMFVFASLPTLCSYARSTGHLSIKQEHHQPSGT